jgi:hypothetical protein
LTFVVLVILAALWAVVLLPPLLRSRTERTTDSIGDFNYRLDVLGRTNGALNTDRRRIVPGERSAKRRRDVMRVLLVAVGASGLLALATNAQMLWAVHVTSDIALLGFFALWAWARSVQAERERKVETIRPRRTSDLALRRAASS